MAMTPLCLLLFVHLIFYANSLQLISKFLFYFIILAFFLLFALDLFYSFFSFFLSQVGEMDPLLDDSVDFVQKLRRIRKVDVVVTIESFHSLLPQKNRREEYQFDETEVVDKVFFLLFLRKKGREGD